MLEAGMEWGQQPGHGGEKGGQAGIQEVYLETLSPVDLSLLGNDAKAIMVHLHTEGICTAFSCLRLEDEFLKA